MEECGNESEVHSLYWYRRLVIGTFITFSYFHILSNTFAA